MAARAPRSAALLAVIAAAAVAVVLIARGGGERHHLSVEVSEATNVVAGQSVRSAGNPVGSVTKLTPLAGGRRARIDIELDGTTWPLTRGTRMALHWGGTANFSNRFIELLPGRADAPAMATDGTFPAGSFSIPVEFDGLLRTFDRPLRRDARAMLDRMGPAVRHAAPALRRTLDRGPAALEQTRLVLRDLDLEKARLAGMIDASSRVLGAVERARPGVRTLLSGAAATFDAMAADTDALEHTLAQAPGVLRRTRGTLARADRTLDLARVVTGRLAPGVTELRRTARPLNGTLEAVSRVGPDVRATLSSVREATPALDPLLTRTRTLSPQLESVGRQTVENAKCIRPYTPSIVGFFSTWADFFSHGDGKDKMIRAQVQNYLPAATNANAYTSGQAAKQFPGLEFGFPRPPGTAAGQPWFLPECGAGRDALDPDKDPEARPYNAIAHLPRGGSIGGFVSPAGGR
ncbi:MAG: hypothetical protein JWO02_3295 [Solirubrobacterales bacterium]|nr:hypothetical protein [Solirubrobacterales bacterium]